MSAIEKYHEQPLALIESIDDLARLSKQVAESRYYGDMQSAQQAAVKLMIARELGLGVTAISNIHLVDGKIQLGYQILIALVKRSGKYNMRFLERTDEIVRIEWFEDGESVGFSKFDMKDAERAGLTKPSRSGNPSNFTKYPIRMLTARAVSDGFSTFTPECAGGALYTDGEIAEVPEPAPRPARREQPAPTTLPEETVVEAEIVTEAPVAGATAEPNSPDLSEGESAPVTITPTFTKTALDAERLFGAQIRGGHQNDTVAAVLKSMTAKQRKAVREACERIEIPWNDKTPAALFDRFGTLAMELSTLLPALADAVSVPPVGTADGEVETSDPAEFQRWLDEDAAKNADDAIAAVRSRHDALAAAGGYGE